VERGPSRSSLLAAKLRSLVVSSFGPAERVDVSFPGGAGLVSGPTAWVLLDPAPLTSFGPALVWADRRGADDLHLLMDSDAEIVARRAACFEPAPLVWRIDGTTLTRAEPAPPAVAEPAAPAPELAALLVDADVEVLVEDGIVRGEVSGLEVARIVHGTTSSGTPIDEPLLEVGVGHADRELTSVVHGSLPPVEQLARVVDIVREHRRPGAEPHPLNQLAAERWLRARLVARPELIGMARLHPIPPTVPRPNLRDPAVALAAGERPDGQRVVVACSVGVDLGLVPAAADARLAVDPDASLLLVVPERDAHPVTRALAARLTRPAEVVAVDDDWRRGEPRPVGSAR
jgi:hypothetical protein